MKTIKKFCALVVCALASLPSLAQQTYLEMEQLTINENVTTVITASEPVRFVDISTDAVVGDQPINQYHPFETPRKVQPYMQMVTSLLL